MDNSLLQPLAGAIFMGLGAGFLTYAYGDKFARIKNRKIKNETPEKYYDPTRPETRDNARIIRAVSAGFFMGVMFLIYFTNR